jgi:hypothetical protein
LSSCRHTMSGPASRSQRSRFRKRRLMLKLAIFIVQLGTRGIGWRSASHLNRLRSKFGCGHTAQEFRFTACLRSHAGPTIRKSPPSLFDTVSYCSSLLGREIARHPPAPRTHHGGGVRGSPRKFAAPFSISTVRQLLRQRCDARGFTPLPIEIIARQKVSPAFEPQKVSGRALVQIAGAGKRPVLCCRDFKLGARHSCRVWGDHFNSSRALSRR